MSSAGCHFDRNAAAAWTDGSAEPSRFSFSIDAVLSDPCSRCGMLLDGSGCLPELRVASAVGAG